MLTQRKSSKSLQTLMLNKVYSLSIYHCQKAQTTQIRS
ncbi:hypothetical protein T4E_11543 [Trichinella pseudospiralis]|uniref:Uncharacterized protein n=1 Tax=Trichinella pseudospiralis TaxID=6337 RepID=A0A0V0WUB9_TRIPS|nr:hypothetical protein T4E_11543 [Trichinella pseudospiralis]